MQVLWYEIAGMVVFAVVVTALLCYRILSPEAVTESGTINVDDLPDDAKGYVNLNNPSVSGARFGLLGELWGCYKHYLRRRRLAKKGYAQWFRIENGTLSGPHYVRPEADAESPIPFVEHDGGRYFFPDKAMVSDTSVGMWTAVHRKGEADPINLRDGDEDAISAEAAQKWSEMAVTSEKPGGLLGGLGDLSAQQMMAIAIGGVVLVTVLMGGI